MPTATETRDLRTDALMSSLPKPAPRASLFVGWYLHGQPARLSLPHLLCLRTLLSGSFSFSCLPLRGLAAVENLFVVALAPLRDGSCSPGLLVFRLPCLLPLFHPCVSVHPASTSPFAGPCSSAPLAPAQPLEAAGQTGANSCRRMQECCV